MKARKLKNLKGFLDDSYILSHYSVAYDINSDNRYKHIDELLLYDRKVIKATINRVEFGVVPIDGTIEFVVTAAEENRVDLVSLKFYGSSKFYWIICANNNISDPYNLPIGKLLSIPNISGIRKGYNPLA